MQANLSHPTPTRWTTLKVSSYDSIKDDALNRAIDTPANFSISGSCTELADEKIIEISLKQATVSGARFNVYPGRDTVIIEEAGNLYNIVMPPYWYDPTTFVTQFNIAAAAVMPGTPTTLSVIGALNNHRFLFTDANGIRVRWDLMTPGMVEFLAGDPINIGTTLPTQIATNYIHNDDWLTEKAMHLYYDIIGAQTVETSETSSTYMFTLPGANNHSYSRWTASSPLRTAAAFLFPDIRHISSYRFTVRDDYGNILPIDRMRNTLLTFNLGLLSKEF